MRICIDSSVFIHGLLTQDGTFARILQEIGPNFFLTIPRLVALEVTRNLETPTQVRQFYTLFEQYDYASIVDDLVPRSLVEKYVNLGLPAKADAFIGAFAEWQDVTFLLSHNRHFLRRLQSPAFMVKTPNEFIDFLYS